MWIRFLKAHSYKPTSQSTVDFKADDLFNAPHDRAAELIESGIAEAHDKGGKTVEKMPEKSRLSPAAQKAATKPANAKGDIVED